MVSVDEAKRISIKRAKGNAKEPNRTQRSPMEPKGAQWNAKATERLHKKAYREAHRKKEKSLQVSGQCTVDRKSRAKHQRPNHRRGINDADGGDFSFVLLQVSVQVCKFH